MVLEIVKLYRDGNRVCAIIGEEPEPKAVAYGIDAQEALELLSVEVFQLPDEALDLSIPMEKEDGDH